MDELRRQRITDNLDRLVRLLNVNDLLLAHLLAQRVLSEGEVETLQTIGRNEGNTRQAFRLFTLLLTRMPEAYDTLVIELRSTNQHQYAVANILDPEEQIQRMLR